MPKCLQQELIYIAELCTQQKDDNRLHLTASLAAYTELVLRHAIHDVSMFVVETLFWSEVPMPCPPNSISYLLEIMTSVICINVLKLSIIIDVSWNYCGVHPNVTCQHFRILV